MTAISSADTLNTFIQAEHAKGLAARNILAELIGSVRKIAYETDYVTARRLLTLIDNAAIASGLERV